MTTREHMAGIWSLGSLDTSTCGISTNSTDMVSKVNGHWVACWVLGIGWLLEKLHIWCQEKTQTHPPLWFDGSGEAWGVVSSESKVLDLETLTRSLCCRVPSQSIVYQMGCDIIVYCLDQASHMLIPGEVIWSFLIWTGETRTLVLRTDEELWKERLYSCVMTWFVHFLTQCVKGKKTFSTYLLWPSKNISLSNNVFSPYY